MNHSQGVSTDRPPMINGQKNMTANAGGGSSEQDPTDQCTVREQDRYMPIANVIRIMRRILPGHAKISDDAKETIQECVSEFIGFVTGEANDRCQQEQRKTITAEDVLFAMSKLGFDSYVDPLSLFLHRYRELEFGSDARGVSSGQTLIAKRGADNGGGYDYGSGGFVAHPVYHSGGGYYGPPPLPPPPPPGFDSSYGPRNNG